MNNNMNNNSAGSQEKSGTAGTAAPKRNTCNEQSLTDRDVLLGRGTPINEHCGNQWFRELVAKRKDSYNSTSCNEKKSEIAETFLRELEADGCRFLKLHDTGEKLDCIVTEGTWVEVQENVKLEKIKQAFRQKRLKATRRPSKPDGDIPTLPSAADAPRIPSRNDSAIVSPPVVGCPNRSDNAMGFSPFSGIVIPGCLPALPPNAFSGGPQVACYQGNRFVTPQKLQPSTFSGRNTRIASPPVAGFPSSPASDGGSNAPITVVLRPHDILLGRGSRSNDYEGNISFRALVESHKSEYMSATATREDKKRIAQEIFDQITTNGGRFLKKEARGKANGTFITDGVHVQVPDTVALEKVKQALRQSLNNRQPRDDDIETNETVIDHDEDQTPHQNLPQPPFGTATEVASTSVGNAPIEVASICAGNALQGFGCPHVNLSHNHSLLDNTTSRSSRHAELVMPENVTQESLLHAKQPDPNKESTREPHGPSDREDALVALDALTILTMAGRPKFTDQQRLEELTLLSNEERAQARMDKFGKLCVTDRQTKKLRRDIDQGSIDFLVCQMKLELDRIPDVQKVAMLEANAKCRLDEFSDARLIQFLRSEGMNVKLAALRFVKYWKCRKETFGPEKFTMRMTLTEALRDDLVAIEEGVLFLLPHVDLSGRLLLFIEPHRRQADRYSPESLLRAIWYILEVAAEKTTDIESDCVLIGFDKTSTIFDFPRATYDRFIEFEKTCLPVRFVATHSCCPNMTMNVMRPIMLALTDQRTRARTLVHNVPESAILDALISYGITSDMLPTELGGNVVLNQREWMATRLAEEMEEIV